MTLREKLMHYTHDLDRGSDLKQEAITTIEHIAQYMDEDELLHHSRPLALAYLALTEDASAPGVHGRWEGWFPYCSICGEEAISHDNGTLHGSHFLTDYCPHCGAKMDGGAEDVF